MANRMLCLGIESSCDETALALVEDGRLVDAVLASQADVHALFGGVVPELASREHYRFVGALFDELMRRSGKTNSDIDLVAAARGPGLLGSLLVGVAFAKGLALGLGKPSACAPSGSRAGAGIALSGPWSAGVGRAYAHLQA